LEWIQFAEASTSWRKYGRCQKCKTKYIRADTYLNTRDTASGSIVITFPNNHHILCWRDGGSNKSFVPYAPRPKTLSNESLRQASALSQHCALSHSETDVHHTGRPINISCDSYLYPISAALNTWYRSGFTSSAATDHPQCRQKSGALLPWKRCAQDIQCRGGGTSPGKKAVPNPQDGNGFECWLLTENGKCNSVWQRRGSKLYTTDTLINTKSTGSSGYGRSKRPKHLSHRQHKGNCLSGLRCLWQWHGLDKGETVLAQSKPMRMEPSRLLRKGKEATLAFYS